jgi:hypothetical protein
MRERQTAAKRPEIVPGEIALALDEAQKWIDPIAILPDTVGV